ncbi:MAG: hypothetical protein ACLFV8_06825 [Alphaproteobacteria bacterium]
MRFLHRGLRGLALVAAGAAACHVPGAAADEIPLDKDKWRFSSERAFVTSYKGTPALSLHNAVAWLEGLRFRDGTIEFKVAFPKDRGFVGVRFRDRDDRNFEHFYLRPHRSGKPDANQYTPVFHGVSGWQIYHGPRFSVPVTYPYGTWIDVKLVVSGDEADVYIDSDKPVLHIADLKHETGEGAIGFDAFLTHAFISDVRITPGKAPELTGEPAALPERPEHLVRSWEVSGPVPQMGPDTDIAAAVNAADWKVLPVESNGIANLARMGPAGEERNTMLARITVRAERDMVKPLQFGFSDKVTAFVNGAPVYGGDNTYRSRDYRFLGTVGRFDTLMLPLKQGRNEIVFAVQEKFGGWAITAAFDDMAGIEAAPATK